MGANVRASADGEPGTRASRRDRHAVWTADLDLVELARIEALDSADRLRADIREACLPNRGSLPTTRMGSVWPGPL
jgi:hypothetical protein